MTTPKNNPLQIWLPLLLALMWVLGWVFSYFFYQKKNDISAQKSYQQLQEILQYIEEHHADNPNIEKLSEEVIKSLLAKLDPHSRYIPPTQLAKAHVGIESEFEGVGISYQILDDTLTVLGVVKDSPAQKSKVQIGDKLLKIDKKNVAGKKNCPPVDTFFVLLRGEKNSKIQTEFLRNQQKIAITLARNTIPSKAIEVAYMLDDKTGFIKVQRFSSEVFKEFKENLTQLKNKGATQLIIDLRDNGGGYLDRAVNMVDELLAGNDAILHTKGKGKNNTKYYAKVKGVFEQGKILLLINENSASATEIFAGALQDHDRAILIGRKTFGKGLVQMPFSLRNGGELRLTTSRYYTPSGRSIQKPYTEYLQDLKEDYPASLFYQDSIKIDKSQPFRTTNGRTVYGGGGIVPDIFVPLDTALYSAQMDLLAYKQAFAVVALDFYLKQKDLFVDISDRIFLERMDKILTENQPQILEKMNDFLQQIYPENANQEKNLQEKNLQDKNAKKSTEKTIKNHFKPYNFSQKEISQINRNIKAEIARFINNENLYFKIISEDDAVFQKAKKELGIIKN